jgi:dipeptidyl aminopeptidase/acylaminoacyl peptidase
VLPFYTYHAFELTHRSDGTVPLPKRGVFVDLFGITDTKPATLAAVRAEMPLHNVHAAMPPALLYHAKDDASVPFAESTKMCEAVRAVGARCDLFAADGLGHGLNRWAERPEEGARVVAWLREVLGPGASASAR